MTYYLKSGNTFKVTNDEAIDLHHRLPAGNYVVKKDSFGNFYLEHIENFRISTTIYGDLEAKADRILNTFQDRQNSTGVVLNGEKGSGKTLLSKMISVKASRLGIPTIVINTAWHGDQFNSFIQMITEPAIILFDEFEKVYDRNEQEAMLTLLDGVFPSKKLFMLTCNDKYRVDYHMRNRPGRIYYMIDFKGLEQSFIREYAAENLRLDLRDHVESLVRISMVFDQFNFDMLKAVVEEMNRYGESPREAMTMINARPEFSGSSRYSIELITAEASTPVPQDLLDDKVWSGNPLTEPPDVSYKVPDPNDSSDFNWEQARFTSEHLRRIDANDGRFVFINDVGEKLILRRAYDRANAYSDLF